MGGERTGSPGAAVARALPGLGWALGLGICAALSPACTTTEAAELTSFDGADLRPGFRAGGLQDMEAFVQAIEDGRVPTPQEFMTSGWQNSQVASLPEPATDTFYTLHAMGAVSRSPHTGDELIALLQLGMNTGRLLRRGPDGAPSVDTGPLGLVVVLDTSGSMARSSKLAQAQQGLHALADAMPSGVVFGLVTFNGESFATWRPRPYVERDHRDALHARINGLEASGGTNLHEGLRRGLLQAAAISGDLEHRHVLLVTDGRPTSGLTDTEAILDLLAQPRPHDVTVDVMGVGESFDAELLTRIAARGGGRRWFATLPKSLATLLPEVLATIATPEVRDLRVEIEPAPGWSVARVPGFVTETHGGLTRLVGPTPRVSSRQIARQIALAREASAAADRKLELAAEARAEADAAPRSKDKRYVATLAEEAAAQAVADARDAWAAILPHTPTPMPALLASTEPGVVLVQLAHTGEVLPEELDGARIATVRWSYELAPSGLHESGEQAPRLVLQPGAASGFFDALSSCRARATLANWQAGEAARVAIAAWHAAQEATPPATADLAAARAGLDPALEAMDTHLATLGEQPAATAPCDGAATKAVRSQIERGAALLTSLRLAMRPPEPGG